MSLLDQKIKIIFARLKKYVIAFCGIVLLLIVIKLFNYAVSDPVSDKAYKQYFNSGYKVFGITLPRDLNFAGEPVPLSDYSVRESIDRELMINTYWQSQTLLFFKKSNRWFPLIEPILKRNGIPDDFKFLALAESGFSNIVSPAGAAGFWQFVESTGRSYGLMINEEVDERYHAEKSTEAACKYFKEAFEKYHNWTLVAASYNAGMGSIDKSLEKQKASSYYSLFLNEETGRYVFRLLAIKDIMQRPKAYGFELRKKDLYAPLQTYQVKVDSSITDLPAFAIHLGVTYKELKILNPWLRKSMLLNPEKKLFVILLLKKGANLFEMEEPSGSTISPDTSRFVSPAELALDSLSRTFVYHVKEKETVSAIAKKYGMDEKQLRSWNHLENNTELKAGQEIILLRINK